MNFPFYSLKQLTVMDNSGISRTAVARLRQCPVSNDRLVAQPQMSRLVMMFVRLCRPVVLLRLILQMIYCFCENLKRCFPVVIFGLVTAISLKLFAFDCFALVRWNFVLLLCFIYGASQFEYLLVSVIQD